MNTNLRNLGLAALAAFAFTSAASAISITPATATVLTGDDTSQSAIDALIAGSLGSSTFLYKQNVGGPEEGILAGSYQTVFANTPGDPADATITYMSGMVITPIAYLLVKDGNQTPSWYLYDLTGLGWTGTQTLELTDFWPAQGAISHVSLYGTTGEVPGPGPSVPDGGATVTLLGLGLTLMAAIRRMMA